MVQLTVWTVTIATFLCFSAEHITHHAGVGFFPDSHHKANMPCSLLHACVSMGFAVFKLPSSRFSLHACHLPPMTGDFLHHTSPHWQKRLSHHKAHLQSHTEETRAAGTLVGGPAHPSGCHQATLPLWTAPASCHAGITIPTCAFLLGTLMVSPVHMNNLWLLVLLSVYCFCL